MLRRIAVSSLLALSVAFIPVTSSWASSEVCGDAQDNDGDGLADDGCYPQSVTGVCEQPLSCARRPTVSPGTGNLTYWMPPDITPVVPYGPGIGFRRVYISKFDPGYPYVGADTSDYKTAMGYRWQHNFMSYLEKFTSPDPDEVFVHTVTGRDIKFTYDRTAIGYDYYEPQPGHYFAYLRQSTASPYDWELKTLTGRVYVYDTNGSIAKLSGIKDALGNEVTISYRGSDGQVDEVKDAIGHKKLSFHYQTTGEKLLEYVKLETYDGSAWNVKVSVQFLYLGETHLDQVKIDGTLIQDYSFSDTNYDADTYVTGFADGDSTTLATIVYDYNTAGRVAQLQTGDGDVGYAYDASGCDGGNGTFLYYHRASGTACDADGDCGTNEFCGGETGQPSASTGTCFKVRRCLAFFESNEDLVKTVSATAGGGACSSCVKNKEYEWFSVDGGVIDGDVEATGDGGIMLPSLMSVKDAKGVVTSYVRNSDGLVTQMSEADGTNDERVTYYFYANDDFPGLVTEIRRLSELKTTSNCSATVTTDCKRTVYTYTTGGQIDTVQELGFTYNSSGSVVSYSYTTDYDYDTEGRITQIKGPLSQYADNTDFTYHSDTDDDEDRAGYVKEIKRAKDGSNYVTTTIDKYSFWGHASDIKSPAGDYTCQSFDSKQGYLSEVRQAGNNQTSCTTTDSSDATTKYTRDTFGRLTKLEKPEGNCVHYEYDSEGRRTHIKVRDDCTPTATTGDTYIFEYDAYSSLLTDFTQKSNSNSTVYYKYHTHYNDMRVKFESFSGTSHARVRTYYDDGKLKKYQYENSTGKTEWDYDNLNREEARRKYKDSTNYEEWVITPGVQLDLPTQVDDPDSKAIDWVWDDLGRKVKQVTPDSGTTIYVWDEASRLITMKQALGDSGEVTHTYTYDLLGRPTGHDDDKQSCGASQGDEVQYSYDSGSSCPTGVTCNNTAGRLTWVKVKLWCDTGESDDTFDQTTYYSYDNFGRLEKQTIKDDGGVRSDVVEHTYTKNGVLKNTIRPSGTKTERWFDHSSWNNDGDQPHVVARSTSPWNGIIQSIVYDPGGRVRLYRHLNKIDGNYIWAKFTRNNRPRITKLEYYEQTSSDNVLTIDYTSDDRGRYDTKTYTGAHSSVQDSHYTFNDLNRVVCDSAATGSCPTSGANLKTTMSASPPYTPGGDRKTMEHSHSVYGTYTYTLSLKTGKDQIDTITWGSPTNTVTYTWDDRGNRTSDDDDSGSHDKREYTYDGRGNLLTVDGEWYTGSAWQKYTVTNAYDHKNRRLYKSYLDWGADGQAGTSDDQEAQWFFYYDIKDRLIEIKHTPDIDDTSTYTVFQIFWVQQRPVAYWQLDYPGATATRRYYHSDHQGRPLEVYDWPTSGNASRVWAINPDLFGWDDILTGSSVFQPLRFPGQYWDEETIAYDDSGDPLRPALHYNWNRTYDPYTGSYLQPDPKVDSTWDPYNYVGQNPLMFVDTEGTDRISLWQGLELLNEMLKYCQNLRRLYAQIKHFYITDYERLTTAQKKKYRKMMWDLLADMDAAGCWRAGVKLSPLPTGAESEPQMNSWAYKKYTGLAP